MGNILETAKDLGKEVYTKSEVDSAIGEIDLSSYLEDTAHSFSTNGYQKFSNGLIIQWGATPTGGYVYFPISFPNSLLSLAISRSGNTTADGNNVPEYSILSTSRFYYQAGIAGKYIAIGY